MQQRGFTLIELLFGLLLGGILVTVAVPAFKGLLASQQQRSAAHSLAEGLRLARDAKGLGLCCTGALSAAALFSSGFVAMLCAAKRS